MSEKSYPRTSIRGGLVRRPAVQKITTFLTFDGKAAEAAKLYTSIFSRSKITSESPMSVSFELDGIPYIAMNGGPTFTFALGISLFVSCDDQAEVDRYWDALTADGGEPGRCGWLKDKFGVSWQIVPKVLGKILGDPDADRRNRGLQAMLKMSKLDIATLQAAADGKL